jgi:hypothetical protein
MEREADIAYVRYRYVADRLSPEARLTLTIELSCVFRDHHASQHGRPDWQYTITPVAAHR